MCIIYRPHAHTKEVERLQSMKESSVFPPTSQFSDMSDQQLKEYQQPEQQLDEQQQQQQQQEQVTGSGRALDGDEKVPLMTWAGPYLHTQHHTLSILPLTHPIHVYPRIYNIDQCNLYNL